MPFEGGKVTEQWIGSWLEKKLKSGALQREKWHPHREVRHVVRGSTSPARRSSVACGRGLGSRGLSLGEIRA